MNLWPIIGQNVGRNRTMLVVAVLVLCHCAMASEHRDRGYQYLSPVPQSEYVLPQTRFILVRFEGDSPFDLTNLSTFITVTGVSSGSHSGLTKIASDDKTVIFDMPVDFSSNELVTVSLAPEFDGGTTVEPYEYQFMVSKPMPGSSPAMAEASSKSLSIDSIPEPTMALEPITTAAFATMGLGGAMIMPNGVSVPSDFPDITITANDNPAPGYIYIDYSGSPKYTMMLDSSGSPVWYQRGSAHRDFKLQKNGIITWTTFSGYDQNFNRLESPADSYRAVNGYGTDNHELQVLENGNYLLFGLKSQMVDMTRFVSGGRTNASVKETVLQEFTPEGDLIFQWRAWDNYDIRLMEYWSYDDKPTSSSIRFVHMNAVDVDTDGHLVVSSKRVSEVTKINRDTGEVIWRLGSGNPDNPNDDPYMDQRLTILNDTLPTGQFNVQHDIRVVGENRYTVFDNHHLDNLKNSRAVEYEVDPVNRTATLVWQYMGGYDSFHMGNAQRLPNGNTLINWVITGAPKVTEVRPDGTKAFEMNWSAENSKSYRVFKFPWDGMVETPNLIAEHYPDNITLIFNKFGDPDVDHYNIYGGTSPTPTDLLATSTSTLTRLRNLENGSRYYFRVTAVDSHGAESGFSNEVNIVVNFVLTGQNMVANGDFLEGQNSWVWGVGGSAVADWLVEDGVSYFYIDMPGSQPSDIRLMQTGMRLVEGEEYILEFDAWCDQSPRNISVMVGQDESPWTDYSKMTPRQITPVMTHIEHSFVMEEASDYNSRIVFDLGTSVNDIYLDNISLRETPPDPGEMVSIAIVSDSLSPGMNPDGNHGDDELVAWLSGLGFFVDTTCMNGSCKDGNNPFGNAVTLAALENADIVLVSRHTTSGDYDDYTALWNALDTPIILSSGYLAQSSRWNWAPCGSTNADPWSSTFMTIEPGAENHPFLNGLDAVVKIFDWSTLPISESPRGVYLPSCDFVSGSTLIGRYGNSNRRPMLADIPAGTIFANGNTAGQRRVFFGHWGYDSNLGEPFNRQANWDDFITEDYKKILFNIIKEVLNLSPGDFDFDGCVEFDDLTVLADKWLDANGNFAVDLDGDGEINLKDMAILSGNWAGASCP